MVACALGSSVLAIDTDGTTELYRGEGEKSESEGAGGADAVVDGGVEGGGVGDGEGAVEADAEVGDVRLQDRLAVGAPPRGPEWGMEDVGLQPVWCFGCGQCEPVPVGLPKEPHEVAVGPALA